MAIALVNSRVVMLSIRIISSAIRWHSCFIRTRDACMARNNFVALQACALVLLRGLNGPIQRAKPKIDLIHDKCLRILAYRDGHRASREITQYLIGQGRIAFMRGERGSPLTARAPAVPGSRRSASKARARLCPLNLHASL